MTWIRADLRPLDPVRSIKVKLGLLVGASVVAAAGMTWLSLMVLGWRTRYGLTVAVVIALAVSQALARGMTSPLRQMTAAAREMAAGRTPGPIRTTSRDEVGELARAFTAMSRDLATADAQRRDLLANVAHELRTPLAAVRAQLENLVDGVREADDEALHDVLEQVERLGGLVEDLLGLARSEAGVAPLCRRSVPIASLVAEVVREVTPIHPGRSVAVDVPADLVADADRARLRQVLVNLVENATRHAPDGGRVDVRCRPDGARGLVLEVTDDGPGIPRKEWDEVFERFRLSTVSGSGAASTGGGTGLGLAIARWAVALHGGRIAVVESPRGCRIRAEIPGVALPAGPGPSSSDKRLEETMPSNVPSEPPAQPHDARDQEIRGMAGTGGGVQPAGPELLDHESRAAPRFAPPFVPPPLPAPPAVLSRRFWRDGRRKAAGPGVLAGVVGTALVVALTLPAPAGLQWLLIITAGVVTAVRAAGRPVARPDLALLGIVLALGIVPAVRTSGGMLTLCVLAALGLGGLLAVGGRSWPSVWLTPPTLLVSGVRALPWAWRGARATRVSEGGASWVRGILVAVVVLWVCGGLLISADGAFAGLLQHLAPGFDLSSLPVRVVLGVIAAAFVLAVSFAAAVPPRWSVLRGKRRARPAAEWLVPIVAVDLLLAAFLAVQAAVLFDRYPASLVTGDDTPAERTHQGFGQLVAVTLVILLLLGWAGRRADPDRPAHRRLLAAGGGALGALTLVVVASALRRLWLYEDTFGWTVMRLLVGVFEIWLGAVIVLAGLAWVLRRTAVMPRVVVASAGVVLLGLGLASPDAVVASADVARFERTGKIDMAYLSTLSDDAVPALATLPEAQRRCVLAGRPAAGPTPWYAINISRSRARKVLDHLAYDEAMRSDPACWDMTPSD